MKFGALILVCLMYIFVGVSHMFSQDLNEQITITILYDNYLSKEGCESDWGFSCIIEGLDKTILFDTGTQSDILLSNIDTLNVDLSKIDIIVISHNHRDHTGGLSAILEMNPNVSVYFPHSFPENFCDNFISSDTKMIRMNEPLKILKNVYTTGEMGTSIKEQSLIINTEQGLIIVTGCSHQGIVNILRRTKTIIDRDIYLVFGGFHLLRHSNEEVQRIIKDFRKLGVKNCGATHCTGDMAIELFMQEYEDNYIPMGVGKEFTIDL